MFGGAAPNRTGTGQPNPDGVFADVFDEVPFTAPVCYESCLKLLYLLQLLRPEIERHVPWWTWLGSICGAGLGFIIGNVPGLALGAVAGNRLGAVRDAKGKPVAAVFSELGGQQKAEVS
jgi:hypothetical protein